MYVCVCVSVCVRERERVSLKKRGLVSKVVQRKKEQGREAPRSPTNPPPPPPPPPPRPPSSSQSGLSLWDVDLDAVRPLRRRVLAEGGGALGGHEAAPGLLPLAVGQVQGLPRHQAPLPHRLLWYRS